MCRKITEDTEQLEARDKCPEYLRHHAVDVGLTSSASARSWILLWIHTWDMGCIHPGEKGKRSAGC